jgi:hypothetical protein
MREMKNILVFICLTALLVTSLALTACGNVTISTPVVINTLPTTTPSDAETFTMPDQGVVEIDGNNYYYQRVFASIDGPNSYRDVIFAPKDYGTATPTGVSGWYTITFTDGTIEDLLFAGTLMPQTEYRLTKHENPRAGIMEAYGDNHWVLYVLISME